MSEEKRPSTVPQEAVWNGSQNEWELGTKNEQGKYIGEWKWWLAPNGHLVCESLFDDNGVLINFKRFHPNGEVSRYGSYENGTQIEDVYLKSSEPTTEIFAYGNTEDKVRKAVKKPGVPVSFDYYDKDGNHLNPEIEMKELISSEESEPSEEEIEAAKAQLYENGKGFIKKQFDSDFYLETILPMVKDEEHKSMFDNIIRAALSDKRDFVYHEGDLHLTNLHSLHEMEVGVVFVNGNLTVEKSISLIDAPMEMLVVTGNVRAKNISTGGMFMVFGDLTVGNCLMGDYNDGSAFVGGNLSAKFFYPEEYFFEVVGEVDFTYAFGNAWRLNENQNPEVFNYNGKKLRDFIPFLHQHLHDVASFDENKILLDDDCDALFEFIDRHELMDYIMVNKPVFKDEVA